MLEVLGNVLGNSHFEGWVAGPLMGVIAACIFAGLGNPPSGGGAGGSSSPQDARDQIDDLQIRKQRRNAQAVHHHHYHHGGSGNSNNDNSALLVAVGIALLVAMFLFAAFLPQISLTLYFFISGVAVFSMTATVLALLTGQFNSVEWWRNAIFPFLLSIGCLWVSVLATQAISPNVVAFAQGLLGNGPVSFALVLNSSFKFLRFMGNEYVHWMVFEMLAFICISLCSVMAFMQCVYYIALSNTRASSNMGWQKLTLWTERFSGTRTVIFACVLLITGWFLATGGMYRLIH